MFSGAMHVINTVLFERLTETAEIKAALPSSLHSKLKSLIASIVSANMYCSSSGGCSVKRACTLEHLHFCTNAPTAIGLLVCLFAFAALLILL